MFLIVDGQQFLKNKELIWTNFYYFQDKNDYSAMTPHFQILVESIHNAFIKKVWSGLMVRTQEIGIVCNHFQIPGYWLLVYFHNQLIQINWNKMIDHCHLTKQKGYHVQT